MLERDPKNIFYYQHDVEIYTDHILNFLLVNKNEYNTQDLPICNCGQYILAMSSCNFFVPQDLIDRINSYFQRIDFERNLLLIGF